MRLPFAIQTVYPFTFVLALHISFFPAIQARAETRQEVARTAIIQNLNQTLVETDLLEKELSVYATIDLESVNRENKLNRWTKKLTDRLPNISEKISKDIQKMSDVQVSESLTHAIETLGISREVNKTERENLEVILKNEASKKIPIIAHAIVDHGGIIPFIFDLKNAIRAEKDRWSWFP